MGQGHEEKEYCSRDEATCDRGKKSTVIRLPEDCWEHLLKFMCIPTIGALDSAFTNRKLRGGLMSALRGARLPAFDDHGGYDGESGLSILSYTKKRGIDVRNFKINLPGDRKWGVKRQQAGLPYMNLDPCHLSYAAYTNRVDVMELMLTHRMDNNKMDLKNIDSTDGVGYTALHIASLSLSVKMMRLLLAEGANPNTQCFCNDKSPLHLVCGQSSDNSVECARLLLAQKRTNVNIKDRRGRTPLFAAVKTGCESTVRYLCSSDGGACDVHAQDYADAHTPLHVAAKDGRLLMVKLLVSLGADPTIRNRNGHNPMHIGTPDVARYFKETCNLFDEKDAERQRLLNMMDEQ
jgi:ankyrin repeat protein